MKHQRGTSSLEVVAVIAGIFLTVVAVILLSRTVIMSAKQEHEAAQGDVAERVAPVGQVSVAGEAAPATPAAPAAEAPAAAAEEAAPVYGSKGEEVYNNVCIVCHRDGVAGAPKYGDKDAWAPRIAQGNDVLYQHAIGGFTGKAGMMPPKGGAADLSDDDVKAAVDFMVEAAGGAVAAPAPTSEATPSAEPAPAPAAEAALAAAGDKGKQVYDSVCVACHAAGVAGAPKFGDKDAWAPRIAQGDDTLHQHAIAGYMGKAGLMPPKGGRIDLPDEDVKAAVDYMVNASK